MNSIMKKLLSLVLLATVMFACEEKECTRCAVTIVKSDKFSLDGVCTRIL